MVARPGKGKGYLLCYQVSELVVFQLGHDLSDHVCSFCIDQVMAAVIGFFAAPIVHLPNLLASRIETHIELSFAQDGIRQICVPDFLPKGHALTHGVFLEKGGELVLFFKEAKPQRHGTDAVGRGISFSARV